MCAIAVAGCGEVFPGVDSGAAHLPALFPLLSPRCSHRGWPAFIAGNSPANGGYMGASVALLPTD